MTMLLNYKSILKIIGEKMLIEKKNLFIILLFFICISNINSYGQTQVRIAYGPNIGGYSAAELPNGYLQRIKQNGYTHTIFNVSPTSAMIDIVNKNYTATFVNLMRDIFVKADQFGIKLIPFIPVGSGWDAGFMNGSKILWWTQLGGIFDFETNPDWWNLDGNKATDMRGACSFVENTNGMDLVLPLYVKAIREGFNLAKTARGFTYDLEYICLGGDELLNYSNHHLMIGQCKADQDAIEKLTQAPSNLSVPDAHRRLYATAIARWVNHVKVNSPGTKTIRYSDMLDIAHLGGQPLTTLYSRNGYSGSFTTWQAINESSLAAIKNDLILIPWMYDEQLDGWTYNTENSFNGLISKGFKIIWGASIVHEFNTNSAFSEVITPTRLAQTKNFFKASQKASFQQGIIGFAALIWDNWSDAAPTNAYNTFEYLSYWNRISHPNSNQLRIIPPNKSVNIDRFFMSQTEITQGDYLAIMGKHPFVNYKSANLLLPAENISFYDAILYCNARSLKEGFTCVYSFDPPQTTNFSGENCILLTNLRVDYSQNGYRLPTSTEWQYAYGDAITNYDLYAWHNGNSSGTTQPVATKLPNKFGLFDMAGNVREYIQNNLNNTIYYAQGGGWGDSPVNCKATSWEYGNKSGYSAIVGFRVVRKAPDITPILNLLLN